MKICRIPLLPDSGFIHSFASVLFVISIGYLFCSPNWQVASGQETAEASTDSHELASADERIWNMLSVVMREIENGSILPATRQQMCLSAIRGMYTSADQLSPHSIAPQISGLAEMSQLKKVFTEHLDLLLQSGALDSDTALTAAVSSALQSGAPGSRFVTQKEYLVQKQLRENQYVGIGIQLRYDDGRAIIVESFIGGPAFRAGIRSGDKVMVVDGVDTAGKNLGLVVEMLRGGKGTEVTVQVRNLDGSEPREYHMVRNVVPLPTVRGVSQNDDESWEIMLPDSSQKVAYLQFTSIVGSTAAELNQLAAQAKRERAKALILDLRNVGPSELHHTVMLCDSLVGSGYVADIHGVDGETQVRTRDENALPQIPIIVLYDATTSGTLHMVLSTLKHYSHARLLGSVTTSDGVCRRAQVLPSELGALEGLPYAICRPRLGPATSTERHMGSVADPYRFIRRLLRLQPDVQTEKTGEELMAEAIQLVSRSASNE